MTPTTEIHGEPAGSSCRVEPLVRLPYADVPLEQRHHSFIDELGTLREVYVNLSLDKLRSAIRHGRQVLEDNLKQQQPSRVIEYYVGAAFDCLQDRIANVEEALLRYQETALREVQASDLHS